VRFLLALGLLFAVAFSGSAAASGMSGVVIVVIDGDTVLFKPDHYTPASRAFLKVRLADIDAPENDQPYGGAATQALKALALKRQAQLYIVATDAYGRKVGRLTVEALSVNAEMVRQGWAWASSRDADAAMQALQRKARSERRGLWRDAAPTPPWTWRRAQRAFGY